MIFVVVFGAMFYSIFKHRKSVGHKAAQFHENTTVEMVWTLIPFVILIGMAYPGDQDRDRHEDTSNPDLTIKATGYQWKWGYDYLQGRHQLLQRACPRRATRSTGKAQNASANYLLEVDNPVVVPVGKKVRIITTANDVIHAWWVPAFGVKQDAIPGFVRDTWFKADKPGTYRGQCAELCGKDHGFMPIVVEVVEPEKYAPWVDEQKKNGRSPPPTSPQDLDAGRTEGARRESLRRQLRGLPSGDRHGRSGRIPGAERLEGRDRAESRPDRNVLNGRHGTAMASFEAPVAMRISPR